MLCTFTLRYSEYADQFEMVCNTCYRNNYHFRTTIELHYFMLLEILCAWCNRWLKVAEKDKIEAAYKLGGIQGVAVLCAV